MQRKKETRPSRQARERVSKDVHIVSQNEEALGALLLVGLFLFAILVAPHLIYDYVAPIQGWVQ